MTSGLHGKGAVVTGAAGGLGAASALRLSREGCSVVVVDFHHLNAGIPGSTGGFPGLTADEFDRVMAVNVRGVFLGLRGAFRGYQAAGITGSVVLTASIASLRGSADLIAYQTSKHAVLGLLRGAAMYGGPLGIRVNAVAPGIVPTTLFSPSGRDDMIRRAGRSANPCCAGRGRRTRSPRSSRSCCPMTPRT